jgi:hypothetical protein
MTAGQALALGEWDKARGYHISKQLLAEVVNVDDRRVLDRVMRNAGCAPLIGDLGRIADRELIGIRMMWALVERTDPSVLEVMVKLNGMVVSSEAVSRQVREDVATLQLELERLQGERDMRLEQEQIRRTGSGVDVEGVMAWACEVEQWRFAVRRRETAERALHQALHQAYEAMGEVTAGVRSLRAQLQEAGWRKRNRLYGQLALGPMPSAADAPESRSKATVTPITMG